MIKKRIIVENFKKLGFNNYETEAYLTLLMHNSLSPSKLSSVTKIPRPRVYDVLKGLVSRGILLEQPNKPFNYSATEIEKVIKIIENEIKEKCEEKLSVIKTHSKALIKELKKMKPIEDAERCFILKGTNNLLNWLKIEVTDAKKFINIFEPFDRGLFSKIIRNQSQFVKNLNLKGIVVKYCLLIEKYNLGKLKKLSKIIQIRHFTQKTKVGIYLIDDKQMVIATSTYSKATFDTGILIKDREIIEMAKMSLKRIWEEGIPIEDRENELNKLN